jgi:succinyl-diaminopimelate desuccinylase
MILENDVIPILKELIKFRTVNPPGKTIEAIKYVAKMFENLDIKCKIQEYIEGHANLIAEYGEGAESVILCGHMDVVPAGDESKWSYPPFSGEEHGGKIYGRGSTDMKGAIASFIAVIKYLKQQNVKLNGKIKLLITSDEEIGMEGAKVSLKAGEMENCNFILIGEPTELKIAKAQKGVLWIKIKITGESAHGSTPHLGVNSIEAATELIPKMKETVPDLNHHLLGKSTLNIGQIKGGTAPNVVPEYCEFTLDYRIIPNVNRETIKESIKNIINDFNENNKSQAEMEIMHNTPSIDMTQESRFLDLLKRRAEKDNYGSISGVTFGTDGAILVPENNTAFAIFGPGRLDKLHVTDEYTLKEEVVLYSNIILDTILKHYK